MAERVVSQVVDQDENDVWRSRCFLGTRRFVNEAKGGKSEDD